mgnify:CR=1 FL=1
MKIIQITENMSHTAKRIHDIEKEKGVTPGTPEWFKLWFSLPYLKESITEAFDNPYPYNWDDVYNGDDSFLAKAEMDMGELMVMFTLGKPGVSWTIDFAVDGSMDKTGDGDQFRIFATVVAVIKDWMANKVDLSKVTQIDFSSDKGSAAEDSRSKLYKRFGQQLASKLGWNLEVTDRGQFASFKIKNPNAPAEITESMDNPYAYRWDKQLEDHWVAKADTPAGLMLVMAEWGAGDSSWTIDFAVGGRMGKSGAGDEFRIFATVVAVIKDWITKVDLSNTKLISFSADKSDDVGSSRAKLYARFARQLATQLGWKLEVTSTDDGQEQNDHFKLYKPTTVEEAVNEATEMKISDLTISDAGMAIAQSAGGGSRTDAPLTVTKLPSGHVYLVNGYHRLVDAMKSGKDTVAVEYVPYEKVEILWKQEREDDIKYGKQFNEAVTEEVSLPQDIFHMKNRLLKVKKITDAMGNRPIMFRSFVYDADRIGKIIKKVTNDSGRKIKTGSNQKQQEVLQKLGVNNPTFANLAAGKHADVRRTSLEDHGVAGLQNIFIPISNEIYYSDAVEDLGMGRSTGGKNISLQSHFDVDKAVASYKKGWPPAGFDNEIIVDTDKYYLLNLQSFLLELTSPDIKDQIKRLKIEYDKSYSSNASKNQVDDILKDLFKTKIMTYSNISRWIESVAIPFVDMLGASSVQENFKDGKVKGKSRPGRVKRSGASCNGSVTELRAKAKKASGEKAKMYHWCANMKAGKK